MVVCLCVFMAHVAAAEKRSRAFWAILTFVLCALSGAIPLAYVRVLLAGVVSYGLMLAHKLITEK